MKDGGMVDGKIKSSITTRTVEAGLKAIGRLEVRLSHLAIPGSGKDFYSGAPYLLLKCTPDTVSTYA
jgi:hypothetical protein